MSKPQSELWMSMGPLGRSSHARDGEKNSVTVWGMVISFLSPFIPRRTLILARNTSGIGLQMHEHPYLNSGNPQVLLAGEAFSNEPGIYIERSIDEGLSTGHGIGVRLEDMVLKTEFGWELLSGSGLATSPWEL